MTKSLNDLAHTIHQRNIAKGFYESKKSRPELLMLIVGEVAEACEADRKDQYADRLAFDRELGVGTGNEDEFKTLFELYIKNTFEDEVADSIIRLLDLCDYYGIDIEYFIEQKMRYNLTRPHKHGKKY